LVKLGEFSSVPLLVEQLSSTDKIIRKEAALMFMELAKNNPQSIVQYWKEISQLMHVPLVNRHTDEVVNKSSDCDYHNDVHTDSGIGLSFPKGPLSDF